MRRRLLTVILALLPLALAAQPGRMIARQAQPSRQASFEENLQKLLVAETAIANLYVDSVDEDELVRNAIVGMLENLDPHSTYLTPKENESSQETLTGSFDGIGVQFNMVEDTLFVVQPVVDGPSEKVGILAGDRIVSVNDTAIAGVKMPQEAIMKRLRGPRGTKVVLGVVRRGVAGILNFTVVRDRIPVNTVDASYMVKPGIGYIRISSFGATTVDEFEQKLSELKSQGMKDLVLDLQGNGGGLLVAAIGIANEFLERDRMVVYTEGRTSPKSIYKSDGRGKFRTGRLVVLVDEYSASASEIVSGAVQDWDRGTIVGRRTYGKGLVQRPIEFHDGSLIRLTIAQYFTPSGRCIQKPYGKDIDYGRDIAERLQHGELTSPDSIHFPDSLKYSTLVEKRTVYGGGGIMPDVFVPLDTARTNQYYRDVTANAVVLQSAMQYAEKNRRQLLRRYDDVEAYLSDYKVGDDVYDMLEKKASDAGVAFDEQQFNHVKPIFDVQLKALIGRNLYGMQAYWKGMESLDNTLQKALQLLEKE